MKCARSQTNVSDPSTCTVFRCIALLALGLLASCALIPSMAPPAAAPSPASSTARRTPTIGLVVPPIPGRTLAPRPVALSPTAQPSPARTNTPRPFSNQDIADRLAPIREKYKLPSLGGAIVTGNKGLIAVGVVGVRKAGTNVAVTVNDDWHLGSDTKAMTAAMIGSLVEQGKIKWETTLAEVFPDLAPAMLPDYRKVTLLVCVRMKRAFRTI